jgi:hypothetical protein
VSEKVFDKPFFNRFRSNGSSRDRFMNIHPGVEAYQKQILFIGLRYKGVGYDNQEGLNKLEKILEDYI